MIKTALKHYLYELCIDKIFEGIQENFQLFDTMKSLSEGDCLEVKVLIDDESSDVEQHVIFKQCKILYKKGNNIVMITYDTAIPLYLVLKNEQITELTAEKKANYEDYFKK